MNYWCPNKKDQQYLDLILSMTADCLMGNGTESRNVYIQNLEIIIKKMKEAHDE